jgi:phosphoribosylglycinamide formyltransferase-1
VGVQKNLAIFISGKGSNAKNIVHFFRDSPDVKVQFVFSSKENIEMATFCALHKTDFYTSTNQVEPDVFQSELCLKHNIDWIVLAGYLKKVSTELIKCVDFKIINLHPSLLPKFGGQGMYGKNVHEAVIANKETHSGITIHLVSDAFDEGRVLRQYTCEIQENETVISLENKIHVLEKRYFPSAIAAIIKDYNVSTSDSSKHFPNQ